MVCRLKLMTVEEVAIRVGQLRLEHSTHPPASDSVSERKRQHENNGGQEISACRAVENITSQEAGKTHVSERGIQGRSEVNPKNASY